MTDKRFQITTFGAESQFSRVADQSIVAGLTWEDALKHLEMGTDANIDFALASMEFHKFYNFHNTDGNLCTLAVHSR